MQTRTWITVETPPWDQALIIWLINSTQKEIILTLKCLGSSNAWISSWCNCSSSEHKSFAKKSFPIFRTQILTNPCFSFAWSADENYGRAVLNQYKSQDSLHRYRRISWTLLYCIVTENCVLLLCSLHSKSSTCLILVSARFHCQSDPSVDNRAHVDARLDLGGLKSCVLNSLRLI